MLEVERTRSHKPGHAGTATARAVDYKSPITAGVPALNVDPDPPATSVKNEAPVLVPHAELRSYQTRIPVITGEANYKGMLPVDGLINGQLGSGGGSLAVRQKTATAFAKRPELSGEISFREVVRVNGHIAGTVYSERGTLIIDEMARVDANIEVGTAIINGTVNGDIVAHQRVEIGPGAEIYGNIWTRSIAIKDGAQFEGVCTMIED